MVRADMPIAKSSTFQSIIGLVGMFATFPLSLNLRESILLKYTIS